MDERPLATWKEIAAFLGVSVRTAQNWERNDRLPVGREGNGVKPRVIAYPSKLTEWRRARITNEEKTGETTPRRRSPRIVVLLAALAVVVLLGLPYVRNRWTRSCVPVRVEVRNGTLFAVDHAGETCWSHPLAGLATRLLGQSTGLPGSPTWIEDLDGDGAVEVALVAVPDPHAGDATTLRVFAQDGRVIRSIPLGREWEIEGRKFENRYLGSVLTSVELDGGRHLLLYARHKPFFPARVALVDPLTGAVASEYWHPGHFYDFALADLDGDGVEELLLGGINNPEKGEGHPALAVLGIPFGHHRSIPQRVFGSKYAVERDYLLFPRPDVLDAMNAKLGITTVAAPVPGRVVVTLGSEPPLLHFVLDENLEVVEFTVTDDFREAHARLELAGRLDHALSAEEIESWRRVVRFPTAPAGNSDKIRALFQEVASDRPGRPSAP